MSKGKHRGPTLDSFLKDEGIYDEVKEIVSKEALIWQLQQAMKKKKLTKVQMAASMKTSRAQLDRLLDPKSGNVTLSTLQKAANAVGKSLRVELV
jgi:DNA-binding Xre family transcriptional regulator